MEQIPAPGLGEDLARRWKDLMLPPRWLHSTALHGSFLRNTWTSEPWLDINILVAANERSLLSSTGRLPRYLSPRSFRIDPRGQVVRRAIFTIDVAVFWNGELYAHENYFEHLAQRLLVPLHRSRMQRPHALANLLKGVHRGYRTTISTLNVALSSAKFQQPSVATTDEAYRSSGGVVLFSRK